MTPATLLSDLRAAGFTLYVCADQIMVSPASKLTPEQSQAIRAHKPGLMELLTPVHIPRWVDSWWNTPAPKTEVGPIEVPPFRRLAPGGTKEVAGSVRRGKRKGSVGPTALLPIADGQQRDDGIAGRAPTVTRRIVMLTNPVRILAEGSAGGELRELRQLAEEHPGKFLAAEWWNAWRQAWVRFVWI